MTKERPPSQGGLPQQSNGSTIPLGVNGMGFHSSAVTASSFALGQQTNTLHLEPGTNDHHEPEKDHRFAWLGENLRRKDISPLARCLLGWLILLAQWRKDRLIIIGKGEIAERFGIDARHADRLILELVAGGCLRIVERGGSPKGQRRKANIYALGSAFEGTPPKARPGAKISLVRNGLEVGLSDDRGLVCPPLPIVPPNNTHTKESDSALNEETWKAECLKLNPERDPADITRTLYLAIGEGAKDGFWRHLCRKFNSYYKAPSKPSVTKAFQNQAKPKIKKYNPYSTEGCASVPSYRLAGFSSCSEWLKAGCPNPP